EPLDRTQPGFIAAMKHSVLGDRWVYDGLRDPLYPAMLAGASMTGQGEALGMAVYDGRWYIAPTPVRITGGGWSQERVPVDGFEITADDETAPTLCNDRFEMTFFRRPAPGPRPAMGLTATWPGQEAPVVLSAVREP